MSSYAGVGLRVGLFVGLLVGLLVGVQVANFLFRPKKGVAWVCKRESEWESHA